MTSSASGPSPSRYATYAYTRRIRDSGLASGLVTSRSHREKFFKIEDPAELVLEEA